MAWGILGGVAIASIWAVAVRFLAALGVGVVSFVGLSAALTSLQTEISGYFGQLPASMVAIFSMSGVGVALSVVFAAYVARVSLMVTKRLVLK